MPKINIWIVSFYAVPPKYATMFRDIAFARELTNAGYEVRIFSASTVHNTDIEIDMKGKGFLEAEYEGVKFVHIKTPRYRGNGIMRAFGLWLFPRRIRSVLNHFDAPDFILHSAGVPFDGLMARIARKLKSRYLVEIQDFWPASFIEYGVIGRHNVLLPFLFFLERRQYHNADVLIFSMEGGKEYITDKGWDKAKIYPVQLEKVYHINQGVDLYKHLADLQNYDTDPELEDPGKFKIVYIGSIRQANSLDVVVDAADILQRRGDNRIHFLIYGDGDRRAVLEKNCTDRGINNVTFKGRVAPRNVPGILARSNINLFVFGETRLSKYGISPNKLFLYFASGKPILSAIRPGFDLVERYNAGLSVNNAPNLIADGASYFANLDNVTYEKYCSGSRAAAQDYDYGNSAKRLMRLLIKGKDI